MREKKELEAEAARLKSALDTTMGGWEKDKKIHANTALHCEELEAEVGKLKDEAVEGEQRRRAFIENYEEMKKDRDHLRVEQHAIYKKGGKS